MPFDSLPQTKPLPSTEAELIADFKAWVLRQPEDAQWDYSSLTECAVRSYMNDRGLRRLSIQEAGCQHLNAAAYRASQGDRITRSSLLRELAKLEG